MTDNSLKLLLSKMARQANSGYFVRSKLEGRASDSNQVLKKIENSFSLAVVLSPLVLNDEIEFFKKNVSLPLIQQVESLAEVISVADYFEVLVTPQNLELLENLENFVYRDRAFVTLKDFSFADFLKVQLRVKSFPFFFEFSAYDHQLTTMSVSQVYSLIRKLRANKIEVFGPPGRPVWDSTVPDYLELEPLSNLSFRLGNSESCDFSIIIPTFNSKNFLLNVLRHLAAQDFPSDKFEIIVVDDGSTDGSKEYIESYFNRHPEIKNLKYIYFSRPDGGGTQDFRAGIARNLGVNHSVGRYITFLDSDILTPRNFLKDLQFNLQSWDVIQNVRYHVKPDFSSEATNYDKVSMRNHTFIEEERYWREFFDCRSWASLPVFWKFTCTYCLTVKREDFLSVGRFRRNFVSYGFEDTDLGYRLFKAGKKFFLSRNVTLHLTSEKSKTEHEISRMHRQILLKKTAKKFFLSNLDTAIYDNLRFYMGGEFPTFRKLRKNFNSVFNLKDI